ncbi:MAG: hypothetical protein JWM36_4203 [Hyphomicrobiales bacterium]|nr:hypothetical protein [Hyphomicrobiales bacterium]
MRPPVISAAQAKAARELLGWSEVNVARRLHVLKEWVGRVEGLGGEPALTLGMARRLKDLYESAGVEFLDEADAPGVKLHADICRGHQSS